MQIHVYNKNWRSFPNVATVSDYGPVLSNKAAYGADDEDAYIHFTGLVPYQTSNMMDRTIEYILTNNSITEEKLVTHATKDYPAPIIEDTIRALKEQEYIRFDEGTKTFYLNIEKGKTIHDYW